MWMPIDISNIFIMNFVILHNDVASVDVPNAITATRIARIDVAKLIVMRWKGLGIYKIPFDRVAGSDFPTTAWPGKVDQISQKN